MIKPFNPQDPVNQPTPDAGSSNRFQPNIRPDFSSKKPSQPTPSPARPMSNYDRIRHELANPYENHGKLTEMQQTQLGWEKRVNPLGIREDVQQRSEIYGKNFANPINPTLKRRANNRRRGSF